MSRRDSTGNVEMVETNNIRLSLNRMNKTGGADWKRALHHAILMSEQSYLSNSQKQKIREALEIP